MDSFLVFLGFSIGLVVALVGWLSLKNKGSRKYKAKVIYLNAGEYPCKHCELERRCSAPYEHYCGCFIEGCGHCLERRTASAEAGVLCGIIDQGKTTVYTSTKLAYYVYRRV